MMEAVLTSETSVRYRKTTRHNIPEGSNLLLCCCSSGLWCHVDSCIGTKVWEENKVSIFNPENGRSILSISRANDVESMSFRNGGIHLQLSTASQLIEIIAYCHPHRRESLKFRISRCFGPDTYVSSCYVIWNPLWAFYYFCTNITFFFNMANKFTEIIITGYKEWFTFKLISDVQGLNSESLLS
jgi:hypothetical protein